MHAVVKCSMLYRHTEQKNFGTVQSNNEEEEKDDDDVDEEEAEKCIKFFKLKLLLFHRH